MDGEAGFEPASILIQNQAFYQLNYSPSVKTLNPLVAHEGFEPPYPRPERGVLPLNERATSFKLFGTGGEIRTPGPLIPNQVR